MKTLITLVFGCLLLSQVGCTMTTKRADAAVEWTAPKRDLGRLVLVHELVNVGVEESRETRSEEVEAAITDAFGDLPGTELVDAQQMNGGTDGEVNWQAMSEHELIETARTRNIDTIGRLVVDEYAGMLSVGFLPLPGWKTEMAVDYHLRLLDVASGQVLTDTHRRRAKGGFLALGSRKDMSRLFAADLSELLADP